MARKPRIQKRTQAIIYMEGGIVQDWVVEKGVSIHVIDLDPFTFTDDPHACRCSKSRKVHGHTVIEK